MEKVLRLTQPEWELPETKSAPQGIKSSEQLRQQIQWKGPESRVGVYLGDIFEALYFTDDVYKSLSIVNIVT